MTSIAVSREWFAGSDIRRLPSDSQFRRSIDFGVLSLTVSMSKNKTTINLEFNYWWLSDCEWAKLR